MASARARCPLCHGETTEAFLRDSTRNYLRCRDCKLISVPAEFHLSAEAERAEYDLHQNSPGDAGYRHFLSRLAEPLLARLRPGMRGLDFGSGPGPTLSIMFEEAGYAMDVFDFFYANEPGIFENHYDFITATEVVEHLASPKLELERLYGMLKPGGTLAIMTKLARNKDAFANWHYKNDKTHISFFSSETLGWLARHLGASLEHVAADVVFLSKSELAA